VKYRQALTGAGLVLQIKNLSDRNLSILATFKNPTMHQEKSFRVDIGPGKFTEIGHLEGWTFASGDQIAISHNDYNAWNGSVP